MSTLPGPRGPGPGGPPGTSSDSTRFVMVMAISLALVSLLQFFSTPPPDAGKRPEPAAPAPVAPAPTSAEVPPPAAPADPAAGAPAAGTVEDPPMPEQVVSLGGPRLKLGISTHGGRIVDAQLVEFQEHEGRAEGEQKQGARVNMGGAHGSAGGNLRLEFDGHAASASYRITDESPQSITLEREGGGVHVLRRYRFDPQSYGLRTDIEITNRSDQARALAPLVELTGHVGASEKDQGSFLMPAAATDQTSLLCETAAEVTRTIALGMEKQVVVDGKVLWAGLDRQYFLAGIVPRQGDLAGCTQKLDGQTARLVLTYPKTQLAPGQTITLSSDAYFGPKQEAWLAKVDPLLTNAIDYGWFGALVRLLLALLVYFYSLIPNYGMAIFLLTLSVKLLTLPLTQKAYISQQRMKDLAPKMKEVQEKFAHDKAMQGQKLSELYKQENYNPLSGCLPMLIQMPVWIALYRTLFTAVELYHQPFISGWINDLTEKDPYYITPVALGVVMLIQAWLTPQTTDNVQMKYMQYGMPVFFTFIMLTLPSGLTLYMFFNAVLTIIQQLYIKRRFGTPTTSSTPAPSSGHSDEASGKKRRARRG